MLSAPGDGVKRTTPAMRRMLRLAAFLVTLLGISMYVLAETTDRTAAWTIQPLLTATFLGGAYFASLALEYLGSREREWASARIAVAGVVVFSFVMLGVTLLHLDRFHLGAELDASPRFFGWIWLITYIAVPPVFAWVWWLQINAPGDDPPRQAPMPDRVRTALQLYGSALMLAGIAMLAFPVAVGGAIWPWDLSPLTGRSTGAWLIGLGFVAAHMGREGDWLRGRGAAWGFVAFTLLQLAALVRFPGIVSFADWRTWLYLVTVGGLGLAGSIAIQRGRRPAALQ